jgi:hypothetical protein
MSGDVAAEKAAMHSRAWSLYLELEAWIINAQGKEIAQEIEDALEGDPGLVEIRAVLTWANKFLYEFGLTKIDSREVVDKFNLELENKKHGM